MPRVVLVIHNVRSCHNVGSLFRTAEGLGVTKIYLTGYTPYPAVPNDSRLPHVRDRATKRIAKTALGAEKMVPWRYTEDIVTAVSRLRTAGYEIVAMEQTPKSIDLNSFQPASKIALLVGNEVGGLESEVLDLAVWHIHIPMAGGKESFNVSVAAAIALYRLLI